MSDQVERMLRAEIDRQTSELLKRNDEIKQLRAVITRAKDALLDGQSTQWVHDVLVAALVERK